MANYTWLVGCPSREAAAAYDAASFAADGEPQLAARYMIPFLWLACYGPGDALTVRVRDPASVNGVLQFIVLCAPLPDVIVRLKRRQASVLALVSPAFAPLYEDWIAYLESHYSEHLLLRTEDLFSMDGYERAGLRLQAALRFLAVADTGHRIQERAAIDWFSALEGAFAQRAAGERAQDAAIRWRVHLCGAFEGDDDRAQWPRLPSATEIAFAAAKPETQPSPEPGTRNAREQALAQSVRHGVYADSMSDGLRLAAHKLAGNVPLGIDAPTKGLRKLIGGGGELLYCIGYGAFGLILLAIGLLLLWLGFGAKADRMMLAYGAGSVAISIGLLLGARKAFRAVRAIMRA